LYEIWNLFIAVKSALESKLFNLCYLSLEIHCT